MAPVMKSGAISAADSSFGCLIALVSLLAPQAAAAQTVVTPNAAPIPAASSEALDTLANDAETTIDEIVVTKTRRQVGAVVGDIKPELQLGRTTIQAYGVGSVTELLAELAPQIRSEKGRLSADAIVLLNGRPVTGMEEVRDIPTEAIQRIDILPEEAALKYGYAPDQRVVNVVLRHHFHETVVEVQGRQPTEGGDHSGQAEFDVFRVHGGKRVNVDIRYQETAGLTEAQRGLIAFPARRPYDVVGNVLSSPPGGEIDPALSALAGRPVTIAGVPAAAVTGRALTLADFAATAGFANATDVRGFESLLPATRQASANVALAAPLSAGFSATLDAGATVSRSQWRDGLAGVRLIVPVGDPYSPFGSDIELDRYAANLGPLRRVRNAWTSHLAGGLVRDFGQWRFDLTAYYDHGDTRQRKDGGIDPAPMQARLDALSGGFNPFAPLVGLTMRAPEEAKSRLDVADLQLLASGPLLRVPAGAAFASLRLGDAESWLDALSIQNGISLPSRVARHDLSLRASLDVPVARRGDAPVGLGELWLNANGVVENISGFGTLRTIGGGLNWTPFKGARLIVSGVQEQAAPSVQQLGDPLYTINRSPILDFTAGQTIDVRRLLGGNAGLAAEDRRLFNVGLELKPFPGRGLTLTANYTDARIGNPIEVFPAATTRLQLAFPDRFTKDVSGLLTQVDYRPVNFASEQRRDLRWGFDYIQTFGPAPAPRADSASGGRPPASTFEGGRLQLAVHHTVYFQDDQLVRAGGPRLNLLGGDPASTFGGQPRHEIEAQAGVARSGVGVRLSADWLSATTVHDASGLPASDLIFSSVLRFDVRLFANLDSVPGLDRRYPWLRGSRVTLSVTNLFDERVQVRDAAGATPLAYQAAYLDPIGRTVRISFRKAF